MNTPLHRIITLDNGLRLVHLRQPSTHAAIFGIVVRAGSADETDDTWGLAHLVEHTIFKGTLTRSSHAIINRMEQVGGELNAFTAKEDTTVYTVFPSAYPVRAISLIADLVINSRFPERETARERDVVLDEIDSYLDIPSEAIYDDFDDIVFAGTPLGHNILGTARSVERLTGDDCRRFLSRYYTVGRSVVFYSGPSGADRIARLCNQYFAAMPAGTAAESPGAIPFTGGSHTRHLDSLHQTHALAGIPIGGIDDPEVYADALFSNIIGGPGMNSLLNVALRERRGLVYTVESSIARYAATGLLTVYFGCDHSDLDKCLTICRNTFERLADTPTERMTQLLDKAKRQYIGQSIIAAEARENHIMNMARLLLFTGRIPTLRQSTDAICAVTPAQISTRATAFLTPSRLLLTR